MNATGTGDKPFHEMTDDELRSEHKNWAKRVEDATGWPSAYFAAKQLAAITAIGNRRDMGLENSYPIKVNLT